MTAEHSSGSVLVDSALVTHEVLVDGEGSFDGSVLLDGLLGLLHVRGHGVLLGVVEFWGRSVRAGGLTVSVLSRGSGSVWVAFVSHNSSALHEVPSLVQVSSVTSEVSSVARYEVLWGKDDIESFFDGESIRQSFGGTESPA